MFIPSTLVPRKKDAEVSKQDFWKKEILFDKRES